MVTDPATVSVEGFGTKYNPFPNSAPGLAGAVLVRLTTQLNTENGRWVRFRLLNLKQPDWERVGRVLWKAG